jgi:hypothetical protein
MVDSEDRIGTTTTARNTEPLGLLGESHERWKPDGPPTGRPNAAPPRKTSRRTILVDFLEEKEKNAVFARQTLVLVSEESQSGCSKNNVPAVLSRPQKPSLVALEEGLTSRKKDDAFFIQQQGHDTREQQDYRRWVCSSGHGEDCPCHGG